jgi:hypothetical protein
VDVGSGAKDRHRADVLYDWEPRAGAFADLVNCFLAGGRRYSIDFDFVDWKTGKSVGQYRDGTLQMTDAQFRESVRNDSFLLGMAAKPSRFDNSSFLFHHSFIFA